MRTFPVGQFYFNFIFATVKPLNFKIKWDHEPPKKRKIGDESRVFNEEWKYFFGNTVKKAVCLLCHETIAVFNFKEYNLKPKFNLLSSPITADIDTAPEELHAAWTSWHAVKSHSEINV